MVVDLCSVVVACGLTINLIVLRLFFQISWAEKTEYRSKKLDRNDIQSFFFGHSKWLWQIITMIMMIRWWFGWNNFIIHNHICVLEWMCVTWVCFVKNSTFNAVSGSILYYRYIIHVDCQICHFISCRNDFRFNVRKCLCLCILG